MAIVVRQYCLKYALQYIYLCCYNNAMWAVEGTDEFAAWYDTLTPEQQDAIEGRIELLQERGPSLRRPTVGEVETSQYAPQMKELRCS